MRLVLTTLALGLALALPSVPALAAPACAGAAFGKTCMKCDTGACFDSISRKIGACTSSRCGEATGPVATKPSMLKPFTLKPRDENTGY